LGARDVQHRNSAHGLTIGARAPQLLIYVKHLKNIHVKHLKKAQPGPPLATLHPSSWMLLPRAIQSAFPKQERDSLTAVPTANQARAYW
jgi:hypothetical protein